MKTEHIYLSRYDFGKQLFVEHIGCSLTNPAYINDCYIAAYIAHGSGIVNIDKENISVTEGDIFLIKPEVIYKFIPESGLRRIDVYSCLFSSDIIKSAPDNLEEQFTVLSDFLKQNIAYIRAADTDSKEIRDIYIRMIYEQMSNLPGGYDAVAGYLLVLLTKILRNTKTRDFKRIYSKNRAVDEAIRYILVNMYSKVSLKDLSEHLKLSEAFICRLFKEHVGMTTSQFINFLRVDKIKDVLKNTDKPVEAVPELFNCNIDYLKRVFKRETGMSMREYRDKYNYRLRSSDEA